MLTFAFGLFVLPWLALFLGDMLSRDASMVAAGVIFAVCGIGSVFLTGAGVVAARRVPRFRAVPGLLAASALVQSVLAAGMTTAFLAPGALDGSAILVFELYMGAGLMSLTLSILACRFCPPPSIDFDQYGFLGPKKK